MRIGFTTTIPVEVVLAAGHVPVDLNNVFIASQNRDVLLAAAETRGFPTSVCSWIKGIYSCVVSGTVDMVLMVTQGDCSNTMALDEVLTHEGVKTARFAYPADRNPSDLEEELVKLCKVMGTTLDDAEDWRRRLLPLRRRLDELDRAAWSEGRIRYADVRRLQLASSDFMGAVEKFEAEIERLEAASSASRREVDRSIKPRIAVAGVPSALDDLIERIEEMGGEVVLDEIPRQFSMPFFTAGSLVEQYLDYTYPYDVFHRMGDLTRQIQTRRIRGLIHYVQSFCHRQIQDMVIRDMVGVPVLTLEGDRPGKLDERSRIRLQAFLEMLS